MSGPVNHGMCLAPHGAVTSTARIELMAHIVLRQTGTSIAETFAPLIAQGPVASAASVSRAHSLIRFELIDTFVRFEDMERDWVELCERVARPEHVFQGFAWNWHWCNSYLPPEGTGRTRLAIVAGRIDGRLVLVLPLVTVRKAGLKQLCWMGEPVSQYGDAIAAPEAQNLEALKAAWLFAVKATGADLANLRKVRADATIAPLVEALGATITATEAAPYIDLEGFSDFEGFEEKVPTKRRKNRRRQMRRLQELGPVAFDAEENNDNARLLARYAISLKRAWLKTRSQISLAIIDERYSSFFADAAAGRVRPTGCKVLQIRTRNETAAMQVVIEHKGVRFLHIAVYASKFEKFGAGSLLLENAIRSCIDDGIKRFDLLAPKHEYKLEFADKFVDVNDFALALSGKGAVYTRGYLGVRRHLKSAAEAMPSPLKRGLMRAVGLLKRG